MAWQAMVAVYSCLQHQRVAPLVVVHGADEKPLHPMFLACQKAGAMLMRSRNYAGTGAKKWQARNSVGTLMDAAVLGEKLGAEFVVLMDPDLVWTSRVSWPSELATDRTLLEAINTDRAKAICARRGITLPEDPAESLGCRVPYVVPVGLATAIGEAWWAIMEDYVNLTGWTWTDQMAAFSLALAELGLTPRLLHLTQTNYKHEAPVVASMIHYAHPTPCWDKGWFYREGEGEWSDLWHPPQLPIDTAQGWVCREITRAKAFYNELGARAPGPKRPKRPKRAEPDWRVARDTAAHKPLEPKCA